MNIVMVAGHACIRVQKMAIPLIERGHKVHIISRKIPSFYEQYFSFSLCNDVCQMIEAMRLHADAGHVDVFHCHNEPSWFVTALKELTDKPVILDVHDSYLARSTPEEAKAARDAGGFMKHIRETVEERNNFQLADGLVFPGDDFRALVTREFGLDQPALTLPSYVPERFYQYNGRDWHGGLVYEGKVNLPQETQEGGQTGFGYCDYTDLAQRAKALNMDFHLYAARNDAAFVKHYADTAFVHEPEPYEELLAKVARHDWGLVGNTTKTREWQVAMPNKLFEYLATGVPIVAMNADACSDFLREEGIGITVSGPEELGERWREHRDVRKQVIRRRKHWTMNAHIHKLENFYREVMHAVA